MAATLDNRLRFNQGVMENLLGISQQYLEDGMAEDALRALETILMAKPDHGEAQKMRDLCHARLAKNGL